MSNKIKHKIRFVTEIVIETTLDTYPKDVKTHGAALEFDLNVFRQDDPLEMLRAYEGLEPLKFEITGSIVS